MVVMTVMAMEVMVVMDTAVMAATAMVIVMEMDTTGVTDVALMSMPLLLPLMLTALHIPLPTALNLPLHTVLPQLPSTARYLPLLTVMLSLLTPMHIIH